VIRVRVQTIYPDLAAMFNNNTALLSASYDIVMFASITRTCVAPIAPRHAAWRARFDACDAALGYVLVLSVSHDLTICAVRVHVRSRSPVTPPADMPRKRATMRNVRTVCR
jgi:hypothetical protein